MFWHIYPYKEILVQKKYFKIIFHIFYLKKISVLYIKSPKWGTIYQQRKRKENRQIIGLQMLLSKKRGREFVSSDHLNNQPQRAIHAVAQGIQDCQKLDASLSRQHHLLVILQLFKVQKVQKCWPCINSWTSVKGQKHPPT